MDDKEEETPKVPWVLAGSGRARTAAPSSSWKPGSQKPVPWDGPAEKGLAPVLWDGPVEKGLAHSLSVRDNTGRSP